MKTSNFLLCFMTILVMSFPSVAQQETQDETFILLKCHLAIFHPAVIDILLTNDSITYSRYHFANTYKITKLEFDSITNIVRKQKHVKRVGRNDIGIYTLRISKKEDLEVYATDSVDETIQLFLQIVSAMTTTEGKKFYAELFYRKCVELSFDPKNYFQEYLHSSEKAK